MQRGSMAWKSIWLQIENKPLWGQQSGPTSYYLNVTTCSIQQHGRCGPGGHARCVQQQGSTYGKEWVQMGIMAWSLSPFVASNSFLSSHTAPRDSCGDQACATERKHNWPLPFASLEREERVKCNSMEQGHRGSAQSPFINTPDLYLLPFSLSFWQPKMCGEVQPPTLLQEKGSSKVAWLEWRMCERPKSDHWLCSQACFHLLISNGGGRICHIW